MSDTGATQAAPGSRFARNVPVYYLFQFVRGFHFWAAVWFLFLQAEHGLSFARIGLIEAVFGIAILVAEVPTGALADRFGRRFTLCLGAIGFGIATTLFTLLDFPYLIVGYAGMAVAHTFFSGADEALLYDSLRQLRRSDEYEQHQGRSQALATVAMLAATLLSGPLAALLGFQAVMLFSAGGMAAAALIALWFREPPHREAELGEGPPTDDAPQRGVPVLYEIRRGMRITFRVRPILWTILLGGILHATLDIPDFFTQPFIRSHGVDPTDAIDRGLIYSGLLLPGFAGIMIGSLLAGPLAERFGEGRALPIIFLTGLLCYLPLLILDHLVLLAAFAIASACVAAVRPIASGYINRRIPSDQRATVLSMLTLLTGIMLTVLIPVSAVLVDSFDFRAAFALAFGLLVAGGGLIWLRWRSVHLRSEAEDAGEIGLTR